MCDHKRLTFGCNDCRSSVTFYDSDLAIDITRIKNVCDKLEALVNEYKLKDEIAAIIDHCIEDLEPAIESIEREAKVLQNNQYNINGFSKAI